MSFNYFISKASVVAMFALIMWLPAMTVQAEDQPTQISTAPVSTSAPAFKLGELGETASGAVEDSLKACMVRIPAGSTAGQRLIAEASCERDKTDRTSINAVPKV